MKTLIALLIASASIAFPAAINVTWGELVRLADVGTRTKGDTWYTATGPGQQIYSTYNDGTGPIGTSLTCGGNIGMTTQSSDLHTFANTTCLTGLSNGSGGFGLCSGNTYPKSSGLVVYNNKIILPTHCQLGGPPWSASNETLNISSTDDPAGTARHWFRVEDSYAVSSASCAGGTATISTANQSLSAGAVVIVSGVNPPGYNGTFTTTAGTNATTVNYSVTCPGAYVSGGSVLGPGNAHGVAPSTAMWPGNPTKTNSLKFIQYCANNIGCATAVDGSDTYLNGISNGANFGNLYAFHVLKSDMDNSPGDPAKYQYWVLGSSFSSVIADGNPLKCIVGDVVQNCGGLVGITYITDPGLTDGGVYVMVSMARNGGQSLVWWADHFYGPFTLVATQPMTPEAVHSPPTPLAWPNPVAASYRQISLSPYKGVITIQMSGQYTAGTEYAVYQQEIQIENANPVSGLKSGTSSRYEHVQSGLSVLWQFPAYQDLSLIPDASPLGTHSIAMSGSRSAPASAMISLGGFENTNPTFNSTWGSTGGAYSIPTGYGEDFGDFSVLVVAKSDLTAPGGHCCQYVLASGAGPGTGGFQIYTAGATTVFNILGGSISLTCPGAPVSNAYYAYLMMRKGGTAYCFKIDITEPSSASGTAATLGGYTLEIGKTTGYPGNYLRGTVGEIAIWNRALCSAQVSGTCSAEQVDEVRQEFDLVKLESKVRGWRFRDVVRPGGVRVRPVPARPPN